MQLHANARTTPYARELMVRRVLERAEPVKDTESAFGVSRQTVYKWLRRFERFGPKGLRDRSSRPQWMPERTPSFLISETVRLRYRRFTGWRIAQWLGMAVSTVSRWLRRLGLGSLKALEPSRPEKRYERERPGELLHLDTKKLGRIGKPGHRIHGGRSVCSRGVDWEFVHVAVDDHTRLAYVEVLPSENQHDSTAFLKRAGAWFQRQGIQVRELLTDNGNGYRSKQFDRTYEQLQLPHLFTRPYTPRTNGKAERFIQTLTHGWAYGRRYQSSAERTADLPGVASPVQSPPTPSRDRLEATHLSTRDGRAANNVLSTHS